MFYDKNAVKLAAKGRWDEIFHALAPSLDEAQAHAGRHVPCPVHGGKDGFRLYPRYEESGAGVCNSCGQRTDGFAMLCWLNGWTFPQAVQAVGNFLCLALPSGKPGATVPLPQREASSDGAASASVYTGQILFMGLEKYRNGSVFTIRLKTQTGEIVACRGVDLKRAAEAAKLRKDGFAVLCRVAGKKVRLADGKTVTKYLWTAAASESPAQAKEREAREAEERRMESEQKRASVRKLWKMAKPFNPDDPVCAPMRRYLANRSIRADAVDGEELRFMPKCWYCCGAVGKNGKRSRAYPAMIAAVRNAAGEIVTLHRTYLREEGVKAPVAEPKKLMAVADNDTISGCAIRLQPLAKPVDNAGSGGNADILCVAEGIETALSVTTATGYPCWSCVSANGLASFAPPEGVRIVLIFADKDASGVGDGAAEKLRSRLAVSGILAVICRISEPIPAGDKGIDWNDILKRKGAAAFPCRKAEKA